MSRIFLALFAIAAITACSPPPSSNSSNPLQVAEGFTIEKLHQPTEEEGSWVAITQIPDGRFITSDQYGHLFYVTPPAIGKSGTKTKVEKIDVPIGHAQGLLWAFNSLYVSVNSHEGIDGNGSGFYRVTDSDGDGKLDKLTTLLRLEGNGEHGPHSIVLGPDKESLYFIAGNHTDMPEGIGSRISKNWQSDRLLPIIKDPRGHANERKEPGGWILRTNENATSWEVISMGYRNPYDMAFTADGELLVFDSDMEWDMGMPWYRPIRVCHATSGSEFGWRTGSGKWRDYYPDNLPSVVDIGQGSPTGVVMGTGAKFPAKFQQGLFICDWSFGTMYFINLTPSGSSYKGEAEEFLSGVPLPLADMTIAQDGAMYLVVGGRRLESGMYRVTYTGAESTDPVEVSDSDPGKQLREIRHGLEAYHTTHSPNAIQRIWPYLSHEDRHIRYAARVGLENQPTTWANKAINEPNSVARIHSIIALARVGTPDFQAKALAALNKIKVADLTADQQLDLIRAQSLVMMRLGAPNAQQKAKISSMWASVFPSSDPRLNLELSQLLSYIDDPSVVGKTLALMEKNEESSDSPILSDEIIKRSEQYGPTIDKLKGNHPPSQHIAYVKALSEVKSGWTMENRISYFQWFYNALTKNGGASYKGFLEKMRIAALENMSDKDRVELAEATGEALLGPITSTVPDLPKPEGPGRAWGTRDVNELVRGQMHERDFEHGKKMYAAALCGTCHTMQGQGGNIGPDLTNIGTRFGTWDIIRSIITPSEVISDQYGAILIHLKDGSSTVGRILKEEGDSIRLNINPYTPTETIGIASADIESKEESPVSLMPPSLINSLNEKELLDLMAYLKSGGNPDHEVYKPKEQASR